MIIDKYDTYLLQSCKCTTELSQITKKYDLFISGYNNEEMVSRVFTAISADHKIWLLFPDYEIEKSNLKYDEKNIFSMDLDTSNPRLEMIYVNTFLDKYQIVEDFKDKSIAIDITGFVKPYMFYLLLVLKNHFSMIDIIYTEPMSYTNHEDTGFSDDSAISVRSINGYDRRAESSEHDLLLINAGYDFALVSRVAENKKLVKNNKVLIGFPSLQPIMYQENILNFKKVSQELGINASEFDPLFAPANDPFETAKAISNYVIEYTQKHSGMYTIYLVPIGTKSQALGMLLFSLYQKEDLREKNIEIKIIYPFTKGYASDSGKDLFKINKYQLEF